MAMNWDSLRKCISQLLRINAPRVSSLIEICSHKHAFLNTVLKHVLPYHLSFIFWNACLKTMHARTIALQTSPKSKNQCFAILGSYLHRDPFGLH